MGEFNTLYAVLILGGVGGLVAFYGFVQERRFQRMIEAERRDRGNAHPAE